MKVRFEVPTDSIIEFSEILSENELTNEIIGITEDKEVIIEIEFNKSQFSGVEELDKLVGSDEPEEEED